MNYAKSAGETPKVSRQSNDLLGGTQLHMDKHERLKHARMRANFGSASSAAASLGVSTSTYASHENGNRNFNAEDAAKYARRFGVSPNWLLFGTGEMTEKGSNPEPPPASTPLFAAQNAEDEELFREAYRQAREIEDQLIGGRGPRLEFAKMVSVIYDELLRKKTASP